MKTWLSGVLCISLPSSFTARSCANNFPSGILFLEQNMTDLKFKLLESFYKGGRFKDFTEIYKLNLGDSGAVFNALQELKVLQFITITPNFTAAYLTPMGANAYESAKEERDNRAEQNAKKDAEQRAEALQREIDRKKQFRHDFVIVLATVILTIFCERIPKLLDWIISLFQ
jgi:hypothetical protein